MLFYFIFFYFTLSYFILSFLISISILFLFSHHFVFLLLKINMKNIYEIKNNNNESHLTWLCRAKYGQICTLSGYRGVFGQKRRNVGYWCVTVAATRGGSLSIAMQSWLKGNSTHKQEKGELEDKFSQDHRGKSNKARKKNTVPAVKRKRSNTRVKEQKVSNDAVNMNWNVCNWWCVIK